MGACKQACQKKIDKFLIDEEDWRVLRYIQINDRNLNTIVNSYPERQRDWPNEASATGITRCQFQQSPVL
jgi:hypothetical protein